MMQDLIMMCDLHSIWIWYAMWRSMSTLGNSK